MGRKKAGSAKPAKPTADSNRLYYGDNLDVLRAHIADESVDMVYLDPPFQSGRDYNVIYGAESQAKAFSDTWQWDAVAAAAYHEVVQTGGRIGLTLDAFQKVVGNGEMLAYMSMMSIRLLELYRVMKDNASLYLHCDPNASHYLKIVLDAIFGSQNYRGELIWKRSSAHSSSRKYSPVHDTLLFYTKSDQYKWNQTHLPLPQKTIDEWYNNIEEKTGRRYNRADLSATGVREGVSGQPWRGVNPTEKNRHWAIPRFVKDIVGDLETMKALDALDAAGRIHWPKKKGGIPMLKRYLEEAKGVPALDVITHISPLNNVDAERLGYPTQKPVDLLKLLIESSTDPGDVVLDPFCGCGTTVEAAQVMGRHWIGIDITHLAIRLIRQRLELAPGSFQVIGEPADHAGAMELADQDPFQFQQWALGLVGARPPDSKAKKGMDRGIDGIIMFHDGLSSSMKRLIVSVKSGKPKVSEVRDLRGVVQREQAAGGVMITLQPPTKEMKKEAASAGFNMTNHGKFPVLQIITIADLLQGKKLDAPAPAFAKPKRATSKQTELSFPITPAIPTLDMFDAVADGERKPAVSSVSTMTKRDEKKTSGRVARRRREA